MKVTNMLSTHFCLYNCTSPNLLTSHLNFILKYLFNIKPVAYNLIYTMP